MKLSESDGVIWRKTSYLVEVVETLNWFNGNKTLMRNILLLYTVNYSHYNSHSCSLSLLLFCRLFCCVGVEGH